MDIAGSLSLSLPSQGANSAINLPGKQTGQTDNFSQVLQTTVQGKTIVRAPVNAAGEAGEEKAAGKDKELENAGEDVQSLTGSPLAQQVLPLAMLLPQGQTGLASATGPVVDADGGAAVTGTLTPINSAGPTAISSAFNSDLTTTAGLSLTGVAEGETASTATHTPKLSLVTPLPMDGGGQLTGQSMESFVNSSQQAGPSASGDLMNSAEVLQAQQVVPNNSSGKASTSVKAAGNGGSTQPPATILVENTTIIPFRQGLFAAQAPTAAQLPTASAEIADAAELLGEAGTKKTVSIAELMTQTGEAALVFHSRGEHAVAIDNAPVTTQADTPQTVNQQAVLGQIVDKARLQQVPLGSQMVIQLKPEHLGEVTIKIAVEGDVVSAAFHASKPEVRTLLEAAVPQLKQDLAQATGLKIDQVGVYAGLGQFLSDSQREQRQPMPQMRRVREQADEEFQQAMTAVNMIQEGATAQGVDYRI